MLITDHYRGFTLIEILVALLVLCIGVLGLATLQSQLLKQQLDLNDRSRASDLAHELAERLRANPELASLYPANLPAAGCSAAPLPCGIGTGGNGPACEGAELASYDHRDVLCRFSTSNNIHQRINQVDIQQLTVSCTDTPCSGNSEYRLAIHWRSRNSDHRAAVPSVLQLTATPGSH